MEWTENLNEKVGMELYEVRKSEKYYFIGCTLKGCYAGLKYKPHANQLIFHESKHTLK